MTYPLFPRAAKATSDFVSEVRLTSPERIEGYVFHPERLHARFVVELYVDGQPAALMRAELDDDRLRERGIGDGCYRFAFAVSDLTVESASSLEVRIANTNRSLGAPVVAAARCEKNAARRGPGEVTWSGGLRFSGWLSDKPLRPQPEVRAFVDGVCVARAVARQWTHLDDGAGSKAARGFELHLPKELADGRARRASFVDDLARPLIGSPSAFLAFEDRLADIVGARMETASERIRSELHDRCFPQSLPFDLFEDWSRAFPSETTPNQSRRKVALALVGDRGAEASLASLKTQPGFDWVAAVLSDGSREACFDPAQLLEFLDREATECDFVAFALSGTLFHENAFARLAEGLERHPKAPAAYCDVTAATEDGREWPIAFPTFDYERLLEQGYCAYVFAMGLAKAREAAQAGAGNLFRVFNMTLDARRPPPPPPADADPSTVPVHVPGFLAQIPRVDLAAGASLLAEAAADHLRVCGVAAIVEPAEGALFPCARVKRAPRRAKVSLLVPTRDRVDLLRPCIESLRRTLRFDDHELIVIDNDSSDPETLGYLEAIASEGVTVTSLPGRFDFARLINHGAAQASGDYLLALRNGVRALEAGWLEEMLGRAAEPDVGAVGAALVWPSGVVRHGGVVLGVGFAPSPAFADRIEGDPGYADQLIVAHECSAVAGACLLTRRELFLTVGGLDAIRFPLEHYDVDYCLRLRERGFRVVFAPRARLQRVDRPPAREPQTRNSVAERELSRLRSRWGEALLNDPCYSPLLSLNGAPYSGLAWPPRDRSPRLPSWASSRPMPSGF